jgi:hypothetical protein
MNLMKEFSSGEHHSCIEKNPMQEHLIYGSEFAGGCASAATCTARTGSAATIRRRSG